MWSFEKLHRCMAHLFLGQLVSTFDEEFRILFAQSEPLAIDNTPAPVEEFGLSQKTQYPSERISLYRESRKFLSLEGPPEERMKHSFDDRMDLDMRMMHLKRHEPLHGSGEIYSRFPSQQPHMDMSYDQGPYRTSALENPSFKRHSYAEGVQGRFSYPFLQPQGMPEPEIQGRPFHRGQQPYQGQEPDYNVYDKFWNPEYQLDQFSEPGLGQEMQPPDNFDPVLNYLSSTRNMDFDQSSEKILPEPDLPFSSPHPRRLNVGQPYACQTSPTPSSSTDHKSYLQDSNSDRKDPTVKRGLRNWRISSYLSTCDNPSEEGLPLSAGQAPEPFDEPSNPVQQTGPVKDLSYPKIPNVREFKIPAVPRASQIMGYTKNTVREQQKKFSDDSSVVVTVEPKTTPSTSESSSTADVDKAEEAEQKDHKEPKLTTLRLEESFRRKYNAATPRSSRLRSSLIFSSLDQQNTQDDTSSQGQQDEEEQMKTPFVSQLLGQRRSGAREPFEWSRYIKSATGDNSSAETSKPDDEHNKGENEDSKTDKTDNKTLNEEEEPPLSTNASSPQSKPPETEASKFEQPVPAPTTPLTVPLFVDMNDPDERLMFFKQLAAQRKAAKAAEAEKNKGQAPVKTTDTKTDPALKEEPNPKESVESVPNTVKSQGLSDNHGSAEDEAKTCSMEASKSNNGDNTEEGPRSSSDVSASQGCVEEQISTDSEKTLEPKLTTLLPVSTETQIFSRKYPKDFKFPKPAARETSLSRLTFRNAKAPSPELSTDDSKAPKQEDLVSNNEHNSQSRLEKQMRILTDSENKELDSRETTSVPVSAGTETSLCDSELSTPALTDSSLIHCLTTTKADSVNVQFCEPNKSEISIQDSLRESDVPIPQSCKEEQTVPKPEEEVNPSQPSLSVSIETETHADVVFGDLKPSNLVLKCKTPSPTPTEAAAQNIVPLEPGTNKSEVLVQDGCDQTYKGASQSLITDLENQKTVSAETEPTPKDPPDSVLRSTVNDGGPKHQPTLPNTTPVDDPTPELGTKETEILSCDSTSEESSSYGPSSVEVPPSESTKLETVISEPKPLSDKLTGSEISSSNPTVQSSWDYTQDSNSDVLPTLSSDIREEKVEESVSPSPYESSQSQLKSSGNHLTVDSVHAESDISADVCRHTESDTTAPSEGDAFELEDSSGLQTAADISAVLTPSSPKSVSPKDSDLDLSPLTLGQVDTSAVHPPSDHTPSETRPSASEDRNATLSSTKAPLHNQQQQAHPQSDINLGGLATPPAIEIVAHSVIESNGSVLSPEAEKTETNMSTLNSSSATTPAQIITESNQSPVPTADNSHQIEPTSTSPAEPEPTPKTKPYDSNTPETSLENTGQQSGLNNETDLGAVETVSQSSSRMESDGSVLSPEAENTETTLSTQCSSIVSAHEQNTTDSYGSSVLSTTETPSPSGPTSDISTGSTGSTGSESVTPAISSMELSEPAEQSQTQNPEVSADSGENKPEAINKANNSVSTNQAGHLSAQHKQPKTSQSRYQSSTANVISSSNLRDDTKLLLEQISANSQSRNEATKESPVTDDEKEDKADRNAKRESERGTGTLSKEPHKSAQDKERLLERIQSMRKERKVYSRFQV